MTEEDSGLGSNSVESVPVPKIRRARTSDAQSGLDKKTTRIWLEANPDIPPTGLFLGHNGRGYIIKPNEEVDVPNFLIEILNHAVKSVPIVDPQTMQVTGHMEQMRFPYRIVHKPG